MSHSNQPKDQLHFNDAPQPQRPAVIEVATILTFIGCGLGLITFVSNLFQDCDDALDKLERLPEMGGFLDKLMNMSKVSIAIMCENEILILLSSIVGLALCLIGAIQMRSLKKQGFFIYVVGEFLAPLIVFILSLSVMPILAATGFVIPIIMTIVYATQVKHLTR